ncbi:MAG: PIN domain-containing protein [Actinomycetota bacterium]|nr:PIN domain-containing protein [Actinomycetota bacterium]
MNAVDTSVVVAAFASWHESHARAAEAIAARPRLIAHVATESFAVLTRLPPAYRSPAALVVEFLASNFPQKAVVLPGTEHHGFLRRAADSGIRGGAIYDALVAAAAKHEGLDLLTLDERALPTYERLGATIRFLG